MGIQYETLEQWLPSFWRRTRWRGDCVIWTSFINEWGYGVVGLPQFLQEELGVRSMLAHRLAWWIYYDSLPEQNALHICDTPACVNIVHLYDGSVADNNADTHNSGRHPVGGPKKSWKITPRIRDEVLRLRRAGLTYIAIGERLDISRESVRLVVQNLYEFRD